MAPPSDRQEVKAFLLAAGRGTRLGDITQRTPKCLLPIGGRPLLDYWFDALELAGVSDVLINLHHLADQVRDYLEHRVTPIRVIPFFEAHLLGSAGTLHAARNFIGQDDNFFIIYADNFARVDLRRLQQFHTAKNSPILTLVVYPTTEPQRCGIVKLDKDGCVESFEEKPAHPQSRLANAGLHVAHRTLFDYLPSSIPADLGYHVLPQLVGRMYAYVTDEYIQDIGTPETYALAQQAALR